jgi:DNA-directed RNA polymerase subunit N (RpoN/RPB10)
MLPIRCYSCNKVLGNLEGCLTAWKEAHPGEPLLGFYEEYRIVRLCCRKILLTYHNEDTLAHQHTLAEIPSSVRLQPSTTFPQLYRAV